MENYALFGDLLYGFGIFVLVFFIFCLAIAIFELFALSKVFKKAGKPGWAVIVPIYNIIIFLEIIGCKWYYIFLFLVGLVPIVGYLLSVLIALIINIKLAKSFGQEVGFGIGLWLLGGVFIPIMAFSKDIKYVAPAVNGDFDFNNLF